MTSKGDTPAKSKNLSAGHSGPVIIKAHNLKNRVPLSSLANVGCKKDSGMAANSWMTNVTIYPRPDSDTDMAKATTDVPGTVAEPDRPSASDSVEFALQSLFNSDTSIFVSTPNQNPRQISAESVEKILKSPLPANDDDDDVTIVYDSYSTQNAPNIPNCDVKPPVTQPSVGEPANPKTTKVLILRKKNSDNVVKSGAVKTGSLTAKNVNQTKNDRPSINSIDSSEKSKSNLKKNIDQISPKTSSPMTNAKNDTKFESKSVKISNKSVKSNTTVQGSTSGDKEGTFVQVENELEKMFAGIEDNSDPTKIKQPKSMAPSAKNNLSSQLTQNINSSFNSIITAAKTNKKNPSKNMKPTGASLKGVKLNKQNSSSFSKESPSLEPVKKVPMIHIEGSKENPINAHIVNSIKSKEEESSNAKMSLKRKLGNTDPGLTFFK